MQKTSILSLVCATWLAATLSAQSSLSPQAQIAKLQKDTNVVWMGEIYRDYQLEGLEELYTISNAKENAVLPPEKRQHLQSCHILKMQSLNSNGHYSREASSNWKHWLSYQVFMPEVAAFADADLSKPLSKAEKYELSIERDTIESFNPDTFRDTMLPVVNALYHRTRGYRMRELVYFDKKEVLFKIIPLAIAPLKAAHDGSKILEDLPAQPLFWLPVVVSSQPINPSAAPDMPYIRGVDMIMYFDEFKMLVEKKSHAACMDTLMSDVRREKNKRCIPVNSTGEDNPDKLLSIEEVGTLATSVDTFITFDPNTFKDVINTVTAYVGGKSIIGIRANHTIAWDARRRQLVVQVFSISPRIRRLDDKGNVLNEGTVFSYFPHKRYR